MLSSTDILKIFSFTALFATSYCASAGGPLVIEGPAGHTPVTYANPNIVLNLDPGPLGSRSNADADTIIRDAFALWNNVSTSTISLTQGVDLSTDINSSNFQLVLPNATATVLNENDGLNPIVYDSDGSIIDGFFGVGASQQTVGFAASIIFVGQSNFVEGYAVINGRDLPGLTALDFKLLVAHELGHLFGLDHTQTNIDNSESMFSSPGLCQTASPADYAIMYPFICRTVDSLHADDISAISSLYPTANMSQQFGSISGFFVDASGKAVLGANIWAENTVTGEAISTVSDYLAERNGAYTLLLPAGNYTLHANSINPLFNDGSGIGPYTRDAFDLSFQNPHPITPVVYQGNTASGNPAIITVNNGSNTAIVFNSNGETGNILTTSTANNDSGGTVSIGDGGSSGGGGGSSSSGGGGGGTLSLPGIAFLFMSLLLTRRKL